MNDTPLLTNSEIDIIGEVLNISMGAAATAISVILNRQVVITTPTVLTVSKKDFEYKSLEPVIGVRIDYVEGLHGSNFMIMNISDANAMVASLLGEEPASSPEELDEIRTSALGEIMNQMMGAASTALSTFLQKSISISPPSFVEPNQFLGEFYESDAYDSIVAVSFKFFIQDLVDNEFITVFPVDFTKEIVKNVMGNSDMSEKEMSGISDELAEDAGDIAKEAEDIDMDDVVTGHMQIPEFQIGDEEAPAGNPKPKADGSRQDSKGRPSQSASARKNVSVKGLELQRFEDESEDEEQQVSVQESKNIDMLLDLGLKITVELGSAKKTVKDVMNLTKGAIIELDKHADDPVDILVNGQLFARGDVVVIEDNFGVRITEIVRNKK